MSKGESCSSSASATVPSSSSSEQFELMIWLGEEASGWVEPRTSCDHLDCLSSDLFHIPTIGSPCSRCDHTAENWLCLSCKDVFCSRFVNKHMLEHYQQNVHCVALSYSDLSVWCFKCDAYLDAAVMWQLRPAYETAYLLKFGESPPVRTVQCLQLDGNRPTDSSSTS